MSFLKILSTLIVFVEIALFGYLPYIWTSVGQNKRIMSIVGCFAAGLFLALSFLHILPEANEDLKNYFDKKGHN
jgi:zinc transporter ZupT